MGNLTRKAAQILLNEVTAKTLTIKGSGANAKLVVENYGVIALSGVTGFFKHVTAAMTAKSQVLLIKPYYPESKNDFEAGFEVQRTQEFTGFAQHMLVDVKRYAGIVDRLKAEKDGYLDETDAIKIATQIAAMIRKHEGAVVSATAKIPVSLTATEMAALSIEAPELGVTVPIVAGDAIDTLAKLKTKIEASDLGGLVVVNTVDGTLDTDIALNISGADKITFSYPKVALVGNAAVPSFVVKDLEGTGSIESTVEADRAKLTREDVARIFPVKWEHAGTQPLVPIPGQDYAKYRFQIKHDMAYALDGANHIDNYIEEVEFYVLKSAAEASSGANWDAKLYTFIGTSGHDRSKLVHA